jgi:hypothetical protein
MDGGTYPLIIGPDDLDMAAVMPIAVRAIRASPGLLDCTMRELFEAIAGSLKIGLNLDAPGAVSLSPVYNTHTGQTEIRVTLGYRDLLALAQPPQPPAPRAAPAAPATPRSAVLTNKALVKPGSLALDLTSEPDPWEDLPILTQAPAASDAPGVPETPNAGIDPPEPQPADEEQTPAPAAKSKRSRFAEIE